MGIRRSTVKNKKSKRPASAIAVKREEAVRHVLRDRANPRPRGMR